jgi:DNA (cytosine-5)-methyltransferase 1
MPDASGYELKPSKQAAKSRPKKLREYLVADLFCGAGGTSHGAHKAIQERGGKMNLVAVNHWQTAIDTHSANMPLARHYCMNLEDARPDELVPEGYLDILTASPSCTHHSRARGGKPTHDQMRMDPWTVCRWITTLKVRRLLIENVREIVDWGPVDLETGKPIKARKGEYFRAWISALQAAGMRLEWRVLNAADYGDATTRERFFMIGTTDGGPIVWPKQTHAAPHLAEQLDLPAWRTSREVIDWSNRGACLFQRKRPLKPKTLRRIYVGVHRHFGALATLYKQALEIEIRRSCAFYGETVDMYIPAPRHATAIEGACVIEMRGTSTAHGIDRPLPTITAGGTHLGVIDAAAEPFVLSQASGGAPRAVSLPVPTIPCGGAHAVAQAEVGVVGAEAPANAIVFHLTHGGERKTLTEANPLPTITCANRGELGIVTREIVNAVSTPETAAALEDAHARGLLFMENNDPARLRILRLNYRMLTARELASAMSFNDKDGDYLFTGVSGDVIRQIGNAVPVSTAKSLISAIVDTL